MELQVFANAPIEKGKELGDNDGISDESSGSRFYSLRGRFAPTPKSRSNQQDQIEEKEARKEDSKSVGKGSIQQVKDIIQYKEVVANERERITCVRFYMPSCRACKATELSFRRLAAMHAPHGAKFVEVPVTRDNAYLHQGLGVPSYPFAHIYHPYVGLVEEMRINKRNFANFSQALDCYIAGQCDVDYDRNGENAFSP